MSKMTEMKKKTPAEALIKHIDRVSKEVGKWPKWKQVLLRPRRPRNGFKV